MLVVGILPFFYYGYCLWTTFQRQRKEGAIAGAIVASIVMLPYIYFVIAGRVYLLGIPFLFTALFWFFRSQELRTKNE